MPKICGFRWCAMLRRVHRGRSPMTWAVLARHLDKHQLMELVITIGHYVMLSWAITVWGTELEPGQGPRTSHFIDKGDSACPQLNRSGFSCCGAAGIFMKFGCLQSAL